jgi:hypothetical protein
MGNNNGKSGAAVLTPDDVARHLDNDAREIDILSDGTLRERPGNGHLDDELVTRTLKLERTWY